MNVRARLCIAALATGAAVALAAVPATAGPAATATPGFLDPAELPPHPASAWYAGPVTAGQPDPLPVCVGEALPSTAVHRSYWTEFDTNALQVTVVERNERRAGEFAALLRRELADCARKLMERHPGMTAAGKYYGRLNVEEGAHVHGVHTAHEWGASDIALFSVGRDGRTVTVVEWAQMGTFRHARVAGFQATTVRAVEKLS
ncbi:hypothetical protein [Streptomyces cinereospinus]|uniref:Uncharacterized protein n=1 Tax=Streptomyces cinereospinus TaxID=285561 RepID=A0ABV5N5C6_9ACTN